MTRHSIIFGSSTDMEGIETSCIDLIVTSPPYPMMAMWDSMFSVMNPLIGENLTANPMVAFELMHQELDKVWAECHRVLKDGAFLCVNIGNAARSVGGDFQLYDNHSRIVSACIKAGLKELPPVIWRKRTNAPNKFMGSGTLPCGAYVTSEHEYILIFRKGGKREYTEEERYTRRRSAIFFEERNIWYNDTWDIVGAPQKIEASRLRSAAFPLEIPYRLISMYSMKNDTVLDPFGGLQTTAKAAMLLGRHSVGYEIDRGLEGVIRANLEAVPLLERLARSRWLRHLDFIKGRDCKHYNKGLNCNVVTAYETDISIESVKDIILVERGSDSLSYAVTYEPIITDITNNTINDKEKEDNKTDRE